MDTDEAHDLSIFLSHKFLSMCSPEMGAGNCVSNGRVSMKLLGGEVALLSKAHLLELLKLESPSPIDPEVWLKIDSILQHPGWLLDLSCF